MIPTDLPGLNRAARMDGTAFAAIQRANLFAKFEIGIAISAGEPRLVTGERPCWLVPLRLTRPDIGPLGVIGEVRVDAATGEVLAGPDDVARMIDHAGRLAQRAAL